MAASVVRLNCPNAGPVDSYNTQPVIDLRLSGDQGVLQYTRALLHHVEHGQRKTCLRAAWCALCFGDPPRSLGLAIGAQLVLLLSLSSTGELGVTHAAVSGFLKIIDDVFGCAARFEDGDSDDDAVVDVIRLLRQDVTAVAEPEADSDADSDANSAEDDDAGDADDGDAGIDNNHANDTGDY